MSQKPVVNAQECDPSTLGLARKPRPALKRKPQTEVVVQLGPFTDGQITAPEMVRPLEGPTQWLIKPKTGEIVPFDSETPPEKDVVRKYITVGAQDNDVPEDLPKLSEGYVVERVTQDTLPSMDGRVTENGTDTVRVIEKEGPASVEYKDMPPPPPPVTENENPPPPPPPPVDEEEEDCECPPPPVCPPVDEQEECKPDTDPKPYPDPEPEQPVCEDEPEQPVDENEPETGTPPVVYPEPEPYPEQPVDENEPETGTPPVVYPEPEPYPEQPVDENEPETGTPPVVCPEPEPEPVCETDPNCPEVDAVDDCASTKVDCPVIIDVLKNDLGCGDLTIKEASAENGTVEIQDGKLHYTPDQGFCGEDVISYTIGDDNCLTDTAHVYMNVEPGDTPVSENDCPPTSNTDCPDYADSNDYEVDLKMNDYEFSSETYPSVDALIESTEEKVQAFLDQTADYIQTKTSWASGLSSSGFDAPVSAPAEEAAAVC